MPTGQQFVSQQEQQFKDLTDKVRNLSKFTRYDAKSAMVTKGLLVSKKKLPKADFLSELRDIREELNQLHREPIKLFMLSQYINRAGQREMKEAVAALKEVRKAILIAAGEEPEHVPNVIQREFYLLTLVTAVIQLSRWRQILGAAGDSPIPGLAIAEDGPRVVEGRATGAVSYASSESRRSLDSSHSQPDTAVNASQRQEEQQQQQQQQEEEEEEAEDEEEAWEEEEDISDADDGAEVSFYIEDEVIHPEQSDGALNAGQSALQATKTNGFGSSERSMCGESFEASESDGRCSPLSQVTSGTEDAELFEFGDINSPVESVTKQVYNWEHKEWSAEEVQVQFEWDRPIDDGAFHTFVKMYDLSLPKGVQRCIAKYQKLSDDVTDEDMYIDVEMQTVCCAIATVFNRYYPPKSVNFLQQWVILREESDAMPNVSLLVAEPYINARSFRKQSDDGTLNPDTCEAFSHFSWCHTNHTLIVTGFEVVNGLYRSPQIYTTSGQGFGKGNLGQDGIKSFLSAHVCNSVCELLGLQDIGSPAPQRTLLYSAEKLALHVAKFVGGVQPIRNSALPEDLAVLGLSMGEFNLFVDRWRLYTKANSLLGAEAVHFLGDCKIEFPEEGAPRWALVPARQVSFKDLLCYYCTLR